MIEFQKFNLDDKKLYDRYLMNAGERGCEYSFTNLNLWGRQRVAFVENYMVLFSQFERHSVYPFPIGTGDIRPVLDAIIQDARTRGMPCRLSALNAGDCVLLEELYPGQFQFHPDRDSCDYVYAIDNLADLPGRKYQRKRNHVNRFRQNHPDCRTVPITQDNLPAVREMVEAWYAQRMAQEDGDNFHLEQLALKRAFCNMEKLELEGLTLEEDGKILAMTMGSLLTADTFDVHFEKALEDVDGAYTAINQTFAQYIREKYPQVKYLDRDDDMGLPGLRKAKLSYYPDHLIFKFWARLSEADDEN